MMPILAAAAISTSMPPVPAKEETRLSRFVPECVKVRIDKPMLPPMWQAESGTSPRWPGLTENRPHRVRQDGQITEQTGAAGIFQVHSHFFGKHLGAIELLQFGLRNLGKQLFLMPVVQGSHSGKSWTEGEDLPMLRIQRGNIFRHIRARTDER